MSAELVAPCGINCAVCSRYLAYSNNSETVIHCVGCKIRGKKCTRCPTGNINKIEYCYECKNFPCEMLERLEKRYTTGYPRSESPIGNLKYIKRYGMKKFLLKERKEWKCKKCSGVICVHNGKCVSCEKVKHWKKG